MPAARKTIELPALFSEAPGDDLLPVNQQVYRVLRRAIVNGTVPPGMPLSETDVSKQFSVSRQPVRESFIKLSEAGLVKVLPQRGTFVMKISAKQVLDAQFIREAIETAVIRRAANCIDANSLSRLSENLEQQTTACARRDVAEFLSLDDAFHALLAQSIDCPAAWDEIENLKAHMDRVRYLTLGEISPLDDLLAQHKALHLALSTHDEDGAVAAIHSHLQELKKTLLLVEQRFPDWFE